MLKDSLERGAKRSLKRAARKREKRTKVIRTKITMILIRKTVKEKGIEEEKASRMELVGQDDVLNGEKCEEIPMQKMTSN